MKYKTALISLLILLLLSAFAQNPKPAGSSLLRPLLALPLPEGRTYDQAHDSGFIDWSGSVGYVYLHHKDNTSLPPEEGGTFCGNAGGCWEWVTRLSNGGTVSGAFAPVGVAYFEAMVAFTHDSAAGTAVLNACGSSAAWYLYVGPGSGLPGFVSMSVPVPAGCTAWSLSASGGYVDFRSVDANYVSPPPPVSTNTVTPLPTETFTPSPTATGTPVPTATETPTPTETLAPGVTPSNTPTLTDTPSPTLTSTPSQTLPPGVTPSDTPIPTVTPVPPVSTNTPKPPPSGGGQGGSGGFVLPTATFTQTAFFLPAPTDTPHLTPDTSHPSASSGQALTPDLVETARVMIFGTSTPTPTPKPIGRAGKAGSGFPWWLLAAGGAAAYGVSKRKQIAANLTKGQKGGARLSASPSGDCPWWNLICQWKAKERLKELIEQAKGNGAEAIISIVGDAALPGQNAQGRLDWVLDRTRGGLLWPAKYQGHSGSGLAPFGQFKYYFGLDDGLAPEFQDSQFYCRWENPRKWKQVCDSKTIETYRSKSNQIGHFLSAVDMANRGDFGLRLTIAHEKWGDTFRKWGLVKQFFATVVPDWVKQPAHFNLFGRQITIPNPLKKYDLSDSLNHWSEAQTYDQLYLQTGDFQYRRLRDQHLRGILGGNTPSQDPARKGNSLEDLRLSLRGFEFNDWIKANPKASPSQAAEQLRRLITSDGPQNGRNVDKRFPRPIPR